MENNKEKYPYIVIMERPIDIENIEVDIEDYYRNIEIPELENCKGINKKHEDTNKEEWYLTPYIFHYITMETKKFLDSIYSEVVNKDTYYYLSKNIVGRIVKNK